MVRRFQVILSASVVGWVFFYAEPAVGLGVPWSNDSGTADIFDWSGGLSDYGRFGDPVITGNTFIFSPTGFEIESSDGNPASLSDRLTVRLTAHAGHSFTRIRVHEAGEFEIDGTGQVQVSGATFCTDLNQFRIESENWSFNVDHDALPGDVITGDWEGTYFIDFPSGQPTWDDIQVVLNNNLQAISSSGSKSLIRKNEIEIEVPEPLAMVLLSLGGLVFLRRRARG